LGVIAAPRGGNPEGTTVRAAAGVAIEIFALALWINDG
jgi:hypothetical protein